MHTLTTSDVRLKNKENIIRYIYLQRRTHQQLICESLHLTRPTVIPIIRECEESSLIEKNGFYESTGGRKPTAIHFIADGRIGMGVELGLNSYTIISLNLYGETMHTVQYRVPFQNSDEYFKLVCDSILEFIEKNSIPTEKILGIGIVLQGLISADGSRVTYGEILDATDLSIEAFSQFLPYPCKFFHDAEAAALDELWQSPKLHQAIYMNIRSHLSGAIVVNRKFLQGAELKSGLFEHMTLIPGGRLCYCGNRGCMETYCSTQALLKKSESLQAFFSKLRNGCPDSKTTWSNYLKLLASSINNLRMFIDYPIIIGGTLSPYLNANDIAKLHQLIYDNTAFPTEQKFIHSSCCPKSPISRGAALWYIKDYLNQIMGEF